MLRDTRGTRCQDHFITAFFVVVDRHRHRQSRPHAAPQDMKRLEKEKQLDHVRLTMKFKDDYPFTPPFVRIVYPRFKRQTGYIIDGAFCMELLTNQVSSGCARYCPVDVRRCGTLRRRRRRRRCSCCCRQLSVEFVGCSMFVVCVARRWRWR